MLFSWLDVVVVIGILVFTFVGWKNGLIKVGFRLLSFILSIGLAWALHPLLSGALQKTPIYESIFSSASKQVGAGNSGATAFGLQTIMEQGSLAIAEYFAQMILNIISFLIILVVARILLGILKRVLHFVASLPVLGFFNRLGGMAVGFLEGLLVVFVLLSVLSVTPALQEKKPLGYAIEQSVVTRSLYIHNPILKMVTPKTEKEVLEDETVD